MIETTIDGAAFLNSTTQGVARGLITITMKDGTIHCWARSGSAITFGGTTWLPHGQGGRPLLTWKSARAVIGLEVTDFDLMLLCDETVMLGGKRLPLFASQGGFRGARLKLERAYAASDLSAVALTLHRFEGTIQSASSSATTVMLTAESDIAKLNAPIPNTIIQPACNNALFDEACGVSRAAHLYAVGVLAGSTQRSVLIAHPPLPAFPLWPPMMYLDGGILTITDGALTGERRGIRKQTITGAGTSTLELASPLPSVPPVCNGTVLPGCDGAEVRCELAFANINRHRGFPIVPQD